MMPRQPACILALILASAVPASAWHGPGHRLATEVAVEACPAEMPAFFREGGKQIAHCSLDPDLFTRPIGGKELDATEGPEHYFDMEHVRKLRVPDTRYEFLRLIFENKMSAKEVGLLPYALQEWTQKLTVAFAEHRQWPDNPYIQAKCLVYAGTLAHYAADACQPLHTTIHYDGRVSKDGASPRTGIHLRVDALLGKLDIQDKAAFAKGLKVQRYGSLFPAILQQISTMHGLVDTVYSLQKEIPAYEDALKQDTNIGRFTMGQLEASSAFIASLWRTAWHDSAKVKIPEWHQRLPNAEAQTPTGPKTPRSTPGQQKNYGK